MAQYTGDHFPQPNPNTNYKPYSEAYWVQDQKTAGTAGGGCTAATYNDRVLNTVLYSATWASLSSNQITLNAGTYDIFFDAPARACGLYFNRLYNVTDGAVITNGSSHSGNISSSLSTCFGAMHVVRVTFAAQKTIKLQTYTELTRATDGLGMASSQGTEVYGVVVVYKVA